MPANIAEQNKMSNQYKTLALMKPPKPLRKKYNTDYPDRSAFASKARLLQSIWRTEKGYELEEIVEGKRKEVYGNYLKLNFAKESGANFLTKEIFELVKHEVTNKHIEKGRFRI